MNSKLSLLLVLLLTALQVKAEDINALVLHMASGKQVTCQLDEQPVVTFKADELVLTTHMNVVSYQAADVQKFTYTYADPSSVEAAIMPGTQFTFSGNILRATQLSPSSMVYIYTVDGALVSSAKTDSKGAVSVTLPEHSGTVYVVKTSVANFKIQKP